MGMYFLAFKGGGVEHDSSHPCFFAEDMTEKEMDVLCQVMDRRWGYDEELANAGNDWYEFMVAGPTEHTVCFVDLRQQWTTYIGGRQVGNWNYVIQLLQRSADEYAAEIRLIRRKIPRGYFLTVDYGGGEGEVFNYVDNLTDQEIDILGELLQRYIHEQGGVFEVAAKDDLAVEDPARGIHLQWDWEIFRQRIDSNDIDDDNPNLGDYHLSCNVINRILEWRATTPATEVSESESDEGDNTENVADNGIVRADTSADGAGQKDSETDSDQNSAPRLPDTPDVRDLCRLLQKELAKGRTQNEIAREFTGEMPGDDKKAQSLLRQARRYRHLWGDVDI